jgi:hypothetical protein
MGRRKSTTYWLPTTGSPLSPAQLKEPLGITNKHVGYIYLVDPDCKIRWAGNAYATEEERQGLRKAVAVLMARVREGKETSVEVKQPEVAEQV